MATYRRTGELMGTALTHDEALVRSFATVRAPLGDVVSRLVADVRLRAGFQELVEPVLRRERVDVELIANTVEARPDGWRIRFRDLPRCAECGERCKRASLPAGQFAYAGDGYSDRCAALAAPLVFATGALAPWLKRRGVAYEPFEDFYDVLATLDGELVER